jgi:nucleotide-binding universal stress UspA family protein
MYTRILVPLDGSELAEQILPYARFFAEALRIPVGLLRVNEPGSMVPDALARAGADYLADVAESFFAGSVAVSRHVEIGKPAEVIVERAGAESGTLIAMATHGLSGIQRLFLGSVAEKVIHYSGDPVLVVRPT